MGIKINNLNVDEAYSPIVEKALFEDVVLIPGLTYTDQFVEKAGKIYVHKEIATNINPKAVGSDFADETVKDDLAELTIDQSFQFSKKIYGVQANAVKYDVVASQMDLGTKESAQSRQKVGLAYMAKKGTDFKDTTAITASNVRSQCTKIRKALRDNGARLDYWIVNTSVYAAMLEDKNAFAPTLNDEQLRQGIVGRYLGAPVLEANAFQGTITPNGWAKAYDLSKIDIIAGASDALAISDLLSALRVLDGRTFVGTLCQGEVDSGFMVANAKKLIVKFNGAAEASA